MKFLRRKQFLIGWIAVILFALLLLAGGVSTLDVTTHTVYLIPTAEAQPASPPVKTSSEPSNYLTVLSILVVLALPVSILYLILSPEARRRFIQQLIQVALILGIVYLFVTRAWRKIAEAIFGRGGLQGLGFPANTEIQILEPFSPQSPFWLSGIISFILAVVILFIVYRLVLMLRDWVSLNRSPAQELETSARNALVRIQAGQDLRNVILRCYHEMTRAVSEKRQLIRPESSTPREFSRSLEAAGLPAEQVQRLTRLFEMARYSLKRLGRTEEAEAVDCLNAIIACLNRDALAGGPMDDTVLGSKS